MSNRRQLAFRFAFWAAAVFAFAMAVQPHPPELPGAPSDKIQHIAAFLVLAALASFAYPARNPVHLGAGLSLFGAVIELVQFVPMLHRDSDPLDWIADTAAAALMLILLNWLRPRLTRAGAGKS
jgi:hypothetical protein